MEIIKETPFQVGYLVWQVEPPKPSLTVVVKGTFDLGTGGVCAAAELQALPQAETMHEGDLGEPAVRLDSDFALFKERGECFLAGTAHPPGGLAVPALSLGFQVGPVSRRLQLFGDREWVQGSTGFRSSPPIPFASMELRLERCFGGPGYPANPLGIGLSARDERWPLPNIEDPEQLIDSPEARPAPASLFPLPRTFPARLELAGTYDEGWLAARWPHLPVDFRWAYFNAAMPQHQISGYFRGDETIVLEHLHPEHPRLVTRLPGLRPRCLVEPGDGNGASELPLVLDTITVDADAGKVFCLWRGLTAVPDQELEGIRWLYVADESLESERTTAEHGERLAAAAARLEAEQAIEAESPPDVGLDAPPVGVDSEAEAPAAGRDWILTLIARGQSLAGNDLTGADLSGADLRAVDLAETILAGADLSGADLTGARIDGASLAGATLTGTRFNEASLAGADLAGATGQGASFASATLDGAVLDGSQLQDALFVGASLEGAEIVEADLRGADFSAAALVDADLSRARLDRSRFDGARLDDACLEGAAAAGASFSGAAMPRIRAAGGSFAEARFDGVSAPAARFREAVLDRADFSGAQLAAGDFSGASLTKARFGGCVLRSARFSKARLEGAIFFGADLFEALFEGADLRRADLRRTSCFAAEFWNASLEGALLEGANLERTKLAGTR